MFLSLAQQYDPAPFGNLLDMLAKNQFTSGFGVPTVQEPGGSNPANWKLDAPPQSGGLADIIFGAPGGGALSGQQSQAQPKPTAPLTDENLRTLAGMMPKTPALMPFPGAGAAGTRSPQVTMQQLALPVIQNPRAVPTLAQILGLR
jgi:hypothetical protein